MPRIKSNKVVDDPYVAQADFARENGFTSPTFQKLVNAYPKLAPRVIRRHTLILGRRSAFEDFLKKVEKASAAEYAA